MATRFLYHKNLDILEQESYLFRGVFPVFAFCCIFLSSILLLFLAIYFWRKVSMKIQYVRYYMQRLIAPVFYIASQTMWNKLSLWINENESFIDSIDNRLGMAIYLEGSWTRISSIFKSFKITSGYKKLRRFSHPCHPWRKVSTKIQYVRYYMVPTCPDV